MKQTIRTSGMIMPDITVYKSAAEAYERISEEGGLRALDSTTCHDCGDELELVEVICYETSPKSYQHEQEFEEIGYVYECPECGEQFINRKEI